MLDIRIFEHKMLTNKQRQREVLEDEGSMASWTVTPSHCSLGTQTASSASLWGIRLKGWTKCPAGNYPPGIHCVVCTLTVIVAVKAGLMTVSTCMM